jgi:hypothetical protein
MLRNLEKHQKYKALYKPNDFYWGLGVEHETYIETSKMKQITLKELKENRAPERYCVDYYGVYNTETLNNAVDGLFSKDEKILIPILVNSHTFQKTDINGQHKTTYERIPKQNPNFNQTTVYEFIISKKPEYFLTQYDKSYTFDGDTIEFMTQNFYKAKVQDVIAELDKIETEFICELNEIPREGIFKMYGPFKVAQQNYPFASYLTNLKNNAMFNNGTVHINITLPTKLNENAEIEDMDLFIKQHQNYARAFQWISPLLIAKYGAYDPLCESKVNGEKYAAGSQRVAVSRYIGLGTYDTDKMEVGKILTKSRQLLKDIDWYTSFHEKVDYKFLAEIGMDINFNKHYSHGLEFRIFDSIPIADIHDIITFLVYLADFSLDNQITNPKKLPIWHRITENCIHNGKGYHMDVSDQNELYRIFGLSELSKEPQLVTDVFDSIVQCLCVKYNNGLCVKYMIKGETNIVPKLPSLLKQANHTITKDIKVLTENPLKDIVAQNKKIVSNNIQSITQEIKTEVPLALLKKSGWCC